MLWSFKMWLILPSAFKRLGQFISVSTSEHVLLCGWAEHVYNKPLLRVLFEKKDHLVFPKLFPHSSFLHCWLKFLLHNDNSQDPPPLLVGLHTDEMNWIPEFSDHSCRKQIAGQCPFSLHLFYMLGSFDCVVCPRLGSSQFLAERIALYRKIICL